MTGRAQVGAEVAVVVPCYNEAARVAEVIRSVPAGVALIVAVDDASSDGTIRVLEALRDPRVEIIRHDRNRGIGGAMRSGYQRALERGASVIVKMDGDGQMDPRHLPALVAPLLRGQADYTKGNRFNRLRALESMPRARLLGNGMLSFLTKLVSGYWSIFDPTNGYTAIRADVLRGLELRRVAESYFFETSMLIELNIRGAVVRDVDMDARYGDEVSKLSITKVAVQFPPLLLRGLARRFFWRYMVRDFNALTLCALTAVPALLFGVVFGGYHWWRSVATGVPATAGTTILAALPIILGFQSLMTALVLDVIYQPSRPLAGREPVEPREAMNNELPEEVGVWP